MIMIITSEHWDQIINSFIGAGLPTIILALVLIKLYLVWREDKKQEKLNREAEAQKNRESLEEVRSMYEELLTSKESSHQELVKNLKLEIEYHKKASQELLRDSISLLDQMDRTMNYLINQNNNLTKDLSDRLESVLVIRIQEVINQISSK